MSRIAVVLFNLGGPDKPESVQPFLFNLFNDPAIISVPQPFRWLLAKLISSRRAPIAREIYEHLGGGSPLLPNTEAQATALERDLGRRHEAKVFIAMRYWHPLTEETVRAVVDFAPDRIVLLPLYPQYSTTTSGSSLGVWSKAARRVGLDAPATAVCCYPVEPGFVARVRDLVIPALAEAAKAGKPRLLFSAHGLPKKVVNGGDPYQWQVEQSAAAVARAIGQDDLDWVVCYQSRVGPLEWIGPATEDEIKRAGGDGVPVVLVPIAFVSEHSETLVELDIEYRELAEESGVETYLRVPTVDAGEEFIAGLAGLVEEALDGPEGGVCTAADGPRCPGEWSRCPRRQAAGGEGT